MAWFLFLHEKNLSSWQQSRCLAHLLCHCWGGAQATGRGLPFVGSLPHLEHLVHCSHHLPSFQRSDTNRVRHGLPPTCGVVLLGIFPWFNPMVDGVYKPSYNQGGSPCSYNMVTSRSIPHSHFLVIAKVSLQSRVAIPIPTDAVYTWMIFLDSNIKK